MVMIDKSDGLIADSVIFVGLYRRWSVATFSAVCAIDNLASDESR